MWFSIKYENLGINPAIAHILNPTVTVIIVDIHKLLNGFVNDYFRYMMRDYLEFAINTLWIHCHNY